jgi:hypothetical protein
MHGQLLIPFSCTLRKAPAKNCLASSAPGSTSCAAGPTSTPCAQGDLEKCAKLAKALAAMTE